MSVKVDNNLVNDIKIITHQGQIFYPGYIYKDYQHIYLRECQITIECTPPPGVSVAWEIYGGRPSSQSTPLKYGGIGTTVWKDKNTTFKSSKNANEGGLFLIVKATQTSIPVESVVMFSADNKNCVADADTYYSDLGGRGIFNTGNTALWFAPKGDLRINIST